MLLSLSKVAQRPFSQMQGVEEPYGGVRVGESPLLRQESAPAGEAAEGLYGSQEDADDELEEEEDEGEEEEEEEDEGEEDEGSLEEPLPGRLLTG